MTKLLIAWCRCPESNRGPTDYEVDGQNNVSPYSQIVSYSKRLKRCAIFTHGSTGTYRYPSYSFRHFLALLVTTPILLFASFANADDQSTREPSAYILPLPYGFEVQKVIVLRNKNSDLVWRHKGYPERIEMNDEGVRACWTIGDTQLCATNLGQHGGWGDGTPDEHKYIIGSGGQCTDGPCRPADRYVTQGWVRSVGVSHVFRPYSGLSIKVGPTVNIQHWELEASATHDGSQFEAYASRKYTFKSTKVGHGFAVAMDYDGRDLKGNGFTGHLGYTDHHSTCKFKDGEFPSEVCASLTINLGYQRRF